MRPLGRLLPPDAVGHAQGRDDQDPVDGKLVEEVADGGQGRAGLAEAHVEEQAAPPPVLDEGDGAALVGVEIFTEKHHSCHPDNA